MNDADRITELEIRYAHAERMIEDLNQVVIEANTEIAQLTARLQRLERAVSAAQDD